MASKRWYAMRKSLKERGKWTGDRGPPHKVPEQEEGEPEPKQSRTDDGDSPETDPDMPELEPEITPEGKYSYFLFQNVCIWEWIYIALVGKSCITCIRGFTGRGL